MVCKKKGWGKLLPFNFKNSLVKGVQAYLGFTAIFIVIVGIYGGIFSPTEAAGVTAGFCLLSGIFITKGITIKSIPNILLRSGQITGLLAPLIAVSIVMQQILSLLGARAYITEIISALGGYYAILLACMLLVFITGTFLETLPDVINMIKDTMDEGKTESAKDYLNQLLEYLAKRDLNILNLQTTGESILKRLEEKAINDYVKEKAESDVDVALNLQAEMARGK